MKIGRRDGYISVLNFMRFTISFIILMSFAIFADPTTPVLSIGCQPQYPLDGQNVIFTITQLSGFNNPQSGDTWFYKAWTMNYGDGYTVSQVNSGHPTLDPLGGASLSRNYAGRSTAYPVTFTAKIYSRSDTSGENPVKDIPLTISVSVSLPTQPDATLPIISLGSAQQGFSGTPVIFTVSPIQGFNNPPPASTKTKYFYKRWRIDYGNGTSASGENSGFSEIPINNPNVSLSATYSEAKNYTVKFVAEVYPQDDPNRDEAIYYAETTQLVRIDTVNGSFPPAGTPPTLGSVRLEGTLADGIKSSEYTTTGGDNQVIINFYDARASSGTSIDQYQWQIGSTTGTWQYSWSTIGNYADLSTRSDGEYTIYCRVVDHNGLPSSVIAKTIRKDNTAPSIINNPYPFTISYPNGNSHPNNNDIVQFSYNPSQFPDANGLEYCRYIFGDGVERTTTGNSLFHTYNKSGSFIPKVRIYDPAHNFAEVSSGITIYDSMAPVIFFTVPQKDYIDLKSAVISGRGTVYFVNAFNKNSININIVDQDNTEVVSRELANAVNVSGNWPKMGWISYSMANPPSNPSIWSLPLNLQNGQEVRVYARVKDDRNTSLESSCSIVYDDTPPAPVSLNASPIPVPNPATTCYSPGQTIAFSWLASVDVLSPVVEYYINYDDGSQEEKISGLSVNHIFNMQGKHHVRLRCQDLAGNTADSYNDIYIKDTSAPELGSIKFGGPNVRLREDGLYYAKNKDINVFFYKDSAGTLPAYDNCAIAKYKLKNNLAGVYSADQDYPVSPGNMVNWSLNNIDGTQTVYAIIMDGLGSPCLSFNSSAEQNRSVILDQMGPALPVDAIKFYAEPIIINAGGSVNFHWHPSIHAPQKVYYRLSFGSSENDYIVQDNSLSLISYTKQFPNAGTYNVKLYVEDAAGNEVQYPEIILVKVIDNVLPSNIHISIDNGAFYTKSPTRTVTLALQARDNVGCVKYQLKNDNGDWSTEYDIPAGQDPKNVTFNHLNWILPNVEGPHTVTVKFQDSSGNENSATSSIIIYDVTAPLPGSTCNGSVFNCTSPSYHNLKTGVTWFGKTLNLQWCQCDDFASLFGHYEILIDDVVLFTTTDKTKTSTVLTVPSMAISGPKTVYLKVYDKALNVSAYSLTLNIDATPPSITGITVNGMHYDFSQGSVPGPQTDPNEYKPYPNIDLFYQSGNKSVPIIIDAADAESEVSDYSIYRKFVAIPNSYRYCQVYSALPTLNQFVLNQEYFLNIGVSSSTGSEYDLHYYIPHDFFGNYNADLANIIDNYVAPVTVYDANHNPFYTTTPNIRFIGEINSYLPAAYFPLPPNNNLAASDEGNGLAYINWDVIDSDSQYFIEVKEINPNTSTFLIHPVNEYPVPAQAIVGNNYNYGFPLHQSDYELNFNKHYQFKIRSIKPGRRNYFTSWSSWFPSTPIALTIAPPSSVSVSFEAVHPNINIVSWQWDDLLNQGNKGKISRFDVYRGTVPNFALSSGVKVGSKGVNENNPAAHPYHYAYSDNSSLKYQVLYYAIVTVADDGSQSLPVYSSAVPIRVHPAENVTAHDLFTGHSVDVTWDWSIQNSSVPISSFDRFDIYRSEQPLFTKAQAALIGSCNASASKYVFRDNNASQDIAYYYGVILYDTSGRESPMSISAAPVKATIKTPNSLYVFDPALYDAGWNGGKRLELSWRMWETPVDQEIRDNLLKFKIERSTAVDFADKAEQEISINSPDLIKTDVNGVIYYSYTDPGTPALFGNLEDSEFYYCRVIAYIDPEKLPASVNNISPVSASVQGNPLISKPQGLVAVSGDNGYTVNLTWTPNSEADLNHYALLASTSPNVSKTSYELRFDNISKVPDVGDGKIHFTAQPLINDTVYYFCVVAVENSMYESLPSEIVNAKTIDTIKPDSPKNLFASAGNGVVNLQWDKNSEVDLHGYYLYKDGIKIADLNMYYNYYCDANVLNGITYSYYLTAYDWSGLESIPSVGKNAIPNDFNSPAKVLHLQGSGLDTAVKLTWDPNGDKDILMYNVYRDQIPDFSANDSTRIAQVLHSVDNNIEISFKDSPVINDTYYYYKVCAVNNSMQNGPLSDEVCEEPKSGDISIYSINEYKFDGSMDTEDINLTYPYWSLNTKDDYMEINCITTREKIVSIQLEIFQINEDETIENLVYSKINYTPFMTFSDSSTKYKLIWPYVYNVGLLAGKDADIGGLYKVRVKVISSPGTSWEKIFGIHRSIIKIDDSIDQINAGQTGVFRATFDPKKSNKTIKDIVWQVSGMQSGEYVATTRIENNKSVFRLTPKKDLSYKKIKVIAYIPSLDKVKKEINCEIMSLKNISLQIHKIRFDDSYELFSDTTEGYDSDDKNKPCDKSTSIQIPFKWSPSEKNIYADFNTKIDNGATPILQYLVVPACYKKGQTEFNVTIKYSIVNKSDYNGNIYLLLKYSDDAGNNEIVSKIICVSKNQISYNNIIGFKVNNLIFNKIKMNRGTISWEVALNPSLQNTEKITTSSHKIFIINDIPDTGTRQMFDGYDIPANIYDYNVLTPNRLEYCLSRYYDPQNGGSIDRLYELITTPPYFNGENNIWPYKIFNYEKPFKTPTNINWHSSIWWMLIPNYSAIYGKNWNSGACISYANLLCHMLRLIGYSDSKLAWVYPSKDKILNKQEEPPLDHPLWVLCAGSGDNWNNFEGCTKINGKYYAGGFNKPWAIASSQLDLLKNWIKYQKYEQCWIDENGNPARDDAGKLIDPVPTPNGD